MKINLFTESYVNFSSRIFCDANAEQKKKRKGEKRQSFIFNLLDQNKNGKTHEIFLKTVKIGWNVLLMGGRRGLERNAIYILMYTFEQGEQVFFGLVAFFL